MRVAGNPDPDPGGSSAVLRFSAGPRAADEEGRTGTRVREERVLNTERLLETGARGVHLLFDREMIAAAFDQDAAALRRVVDARLSEIQHAAVELLELESAEQGRAFVSGLPDEVRHVIVLLYFELLDDRIRKREPRH